MCDQEFSFSSRFKYVLRQTLGIEPLSPGSKALEYFLPSDVKILAKKVDASLEIENFEKKLDSCISEEDSDSDNEAKFNTNLEWSSQAPRLRELLKNRKNWKLAKSENIYSFFHDLSLKGLRIKYLDEEIHRFENVASLNVSNNMLLSIDYLPHKTRILHAYDNQIET
eukprot:CAMPEP_0204891168 /NCGR_PEP_ID=MMETSP1349-20130617/26579_1 /ASSEMBLY_ACC=CAM_ASM_000710 /TAXON_ID=215587 /ORGANISM="Aplanochytrium stocchinoi, Strain GSBS06" /LENGTH=167 /DNA_ID=CAMNT_0052056333 /DNA_START=525 /DNA_END=1024 /DNA_ORIENTATION=+